MPKARLSAAVDDTDLIPEQSSFETTEYHARIFDYFREGDGHARIEAFAGTGKSTTILRGIEYAPEDNIWLCTFAKRNQEELAERLTNSKATAQTIHSAGYQAIRQHGWGYIKTCKPGYLREEDISTRVTGGMPFGAKRLVGNLFSRARELAPLATDIKPLIDLAVDFDLLPPPGDKLTVEAVARATLNAMELAAAEKPLQTGIDYPDMLFLPLRNGWLVPQFDLVVIDEYQDVTTTQLLFIKSLTKPHGRIVLVGDKHQAIYGFRGAGGGEVQTLISSLRATEYPLPKTYRCPKRVVRVAEPYAPGYQVDDSAPEGMVDELGIEKLVETAEPGDFILSRTNAPLMPVALALLRADKPATIRGRDIAKGLMNLVKRVATGHARESIPAFLDKLVAWHDRETVRLLALKRPDQLTVIDDKKETLAMLARDSQSVDHLLRRLETLFTDEDREGVVLSTVHKAKGLEADRVFLLRNTFMRPAPCVCGHHHVGGGCRRCGCANFMIDDDQRQEERNIFYVGVTRARKHLTMVVSR